MTGMTQMTQFPYTPMTRAHMRVDLYGNLVICVICVIRSPHPEREATP